MAYSIDDHKLQGDDVSFIPSPNVSGKFKPGRPDTIIIHYTAGASADSAVRTFQREDTKVSAHLIIDFGGEVIQMVDFDTIAWHAGRSQLGDRRGFNSYSIGFEIVNAGLLEEDDDGDGYESWWGKEYPESEVVKAIHRNQTSPTYWHKYTDAQIKVVKEICQALIDKYDIKYIYGHEEISPKRKVDPGPAFPLDEMREELLGQGAPADDAASDSVIGKQGKVKASSLNIRSAPSASGDKVADALPQGTKVTVQEESNGWYKVKTTVEIEGWVSADYVKVD